VLKKILIGVPVVLLLAVAVFASVVATRPNEFKVTRSATMAAPPEKVFEQVDDFHKWDAWSPWIELDPNAKIAFDGPSSGKGATFSWDGNDQMGAGSMTILESRPPELLHMELAFTRPMQDTALVEFTCQPAAEGTVVTWTMSGEQNFMEKAICMFMNMDKMVGGDFEKGLAKMKKIVEAEPADSAVTAVTEPGSKAESDSKEAEATESAE